MAAEQRALQRRSSGAGPQKQLAARRQPPVSPADLLLALQGTVGNRAIAKTLAHGGDVQLHGETVPTYDGGRSRVAMGRVRRDPSCTDCPEDQPCVRASGTMTITYHVDVVIHMPAMPDGLSRCQQGRVRAFLRDVLGPHEREHARRYRTYDGTSRRPFVITGCGQADVQQQLQARHDAEAAEREEAASRYSLSIDPFVRPVDLDCE